MSAAEKRRWKKAVKEIESYAAIYPMSNEPRVKLAYLVAAEIVAEIGGVSYSNKPRSVQSTKAKVTPRITHNKLVAGFVARIGGVK